MAEPLDVALAGVRSLLLNEETLVRAVAAGRRRGGSGGGGGEPRWRRAELRYVDLKAGRHLQVTGYDATQAFTSNHAGQDAAEVVDRLLAEPFGNWHVHTAGPEGARELQLRVTKKGEAVVHAAVASATDAAPDRGHDRRKNRLLPEDDPVLRELGIADAHGRVKPSRQAKYRQVEELLRALGAAVDDALASRSLRQPTAEDPWLVVDLGCGNAYLTFAAHRYLNRVRGLPARLVGVDVKEQALHHNSEVAARLGVADSATFVRGEIGSVDLGPVDLGPVDLGVAGARRPDIVLALHACDTATDDALAQAVRWKAPLVLAAPCCHHDVAAQLRSQEAPAPYSVLVRDGILRERFADTLTDALRAATLRLQGYRVDVVEFVESRHTPRNTLIRAVRTGAAGGPAAQEQLAELTGAWRVRPRLVELLG